MRKPSEILRQAAELVSESRNCFDAISDVPLTEASWKAHWEATGIVVQVGASKLTLPVREGVSLYPATPDEQVMLLLFASLFAADEEAEREASDKELARARAHFEGVLCNS